MRAWVDGLIAVLLAPLCAACRSPLVHPTRGCVCADCWNALVVTTGPLCSRCGDRLEVPGVTLCPTCARRHASILQSRAIGPYGGVLRDILHALKYDGRRSLARPLAQRMRDAGASLLREADATVPVPLHSARLRERGFNQAADLAAHLGLPVVHALARARHTASQTTLPAAARHANVAGAFRARRSLRSLHGAAVLLVDDVRTTGATLESCAGVLKEAGVREVLALTAARVGTSPP